MTNELYFYSEKPGHEIKYHHEGDAGIDLPIWDERLTNGEYSGTGEIILNPNQAVTLKTGVRIGLPKGYFGFLDSRSSTSKLKLDLLCRTIDEPYRGNIRVAFINVGNEPVTIKNGDELFQIIIKEYTKVDPVKCFSVDEFIKIAGMTRRGEEGFGSKERKTILGTDNFTIQATKSWTPAQVDKIARGVDSYINLNLPHGFGYAQIAKLCYRTMTAVRTFRHGIPWENLRQQTRDVYCECVLAILQGKCLTATDIYGLFTQLTNEVDGTDVDIIPFYTLETHLQAQFHAMKAIVDEMVEHEQEREE